MNSSLLPAVQEMFRTTEYPICIFSLSVSLSSFILIWVRSVSFVAPAQQWSCRCDETHPHDHTNDHSKSGPFPGMVHCGPYIGRAQTSWISLGSFLLPLHRKDNCISGPTRWWQDPFMSGSMWQTGLRGRRLVFCFSLCQEINSTSVPLFLFPISVNLKC